MTITRQTGELCASFISLCHLVLCLKSILIKLAVSKICKLRVFALLVAFSLVPRLFQWIVERCEENKKENEVQEESGERA